MNSIRIAALLSVCLLAGCNNESSQGSTTESVSAGVSGAERAPAGSATLTWTAPLSNEDGSMLSDLGGYTIYYGTDPANLTQVVNLPVASQMIYMATNLTAGTWYFAIRAYSSAGGEGTATQTMNAEVS